MKGRKRSFPFWARLGLETFPILCLSQQLSALQTIFYIQEIKVQRGM